jgi:hypothetical protein
MESIMSGFDMKYFERRAKEERAMAAAATDRFARQAHERIAAKYEKIASGVNDPMLRIVAS